MRQLTTYLFLAAVAGLILPASGIWAEDDGGTAPPEEGVRPAEDEGVGGPEGRRRGRRGPGRFRGRGRGPGGHGPGHHGPPPIIVALDADKDGEISASEIDGAASALRGLDSNEDGKLTREEIHPHHRRPDGGPDGDCRKDGPRGPRGEGREFGGRRGRGRGPGQAGPPSPEKFVEFMMKNDADGDGRLSKEEAPERMQRRFDRMDENGDGFIDRAELEQAAKRMAEHRRGGRRPGSRPDEAEE